MTANLIECTDNKLKQVKAMHTIIMSMNNEDAYMNWIYCMPDNPSESDFGFFANDENQELFDELTNLFIRITNKYLTDGLFINNKLYKGDD